MCVYVCVCLFVCVFCLYMCVCVLLTIKIKAIRFFRISNWRITTITDKDYLTAFFIAVFFMLFREVFHALTLKIKRLSPYKNYF